MTADNIEVCKVEVEGEKRGLGMGSYEDLMTVGGGVDDCNGVGKDDYVLTNGSDATSDDHRGQDGAESKVDFDSHKKVEAGSYKVVNGGNQLEIHSETDFESHGEVEGGGPKVNGSDQLESSRKGNDAELESGNSKIENGVCFVTEIKGKVDGGKLVKENGVSDVSGGSVVDNGEIKSKSEVAVDERNFAYENGNSRNLEDEVDAKVRDMEVEENDTKTILTEGEGRESGFEKQGDCNSSVDDSGTTEGTDLPSLDNDDKVSIPLGGDGGCDNGSPHVYEVQTGADGDSEEQQQLVQQLGHEDQAKECNTMELQVEKAHVLEDDVQPRLDEVPFKELEPLDDEVKETKSLQDESLEGVIVETQPSDGQVDAPKLHGCSESEPLNGEAHQLPMDDGINGKLSLERQQQEVQPADGENEELRAHEPKNKVKEQGGLGRSEIGGDQQQNDEGEIKDKNDKDITVESEEGQESQPVPLQSEGSEHQSNGTLEVDMQSEATDMPAVDGEVQMVEGRGKSELITEVVGSHDSSVGDEVHLSQVAAETGTVNITDREVSEEDLGSEKTVAVAEVTSISPDGSAMDEDGNDLGATQVEVVDSEDKVVNDSQTVPVSGDTSDSAENCLRCEDHNSSLPVDKSADFPVPSDLETNKEQVVDAAACVTDNCPSSPHDTSSQAKVESGKVVLPSPVDGAKLETKAVNWGADAVNNTLKPKISFGSFECEAPFDIRESVVAGENSESKVKAKVDVPLSTSETNGIHFTGINHDKTSSEVATVEQTNTSEVSASTSKGSGTSFNGENDNSEMARRPFYYLIRIPRYDNEKLREQIRLSELQVEEKTRSRDAVRIKYQKEKDAARDLRSSFEAAKAEERAARELMMAKRREIDSAQSVINLAREATAAEDVDSQILEIDHKIQHETMPLKEETQLVRKLRQLTNLREKLSANTRNQQELQQALDRRVQVEERLKVLRKEMDALRANHSKADESVKAAKKRYDDENASLNGLNVQFKSSDTIRQEAYAHLQSLRRQWSDKNKYFWKYKDDAKVANDYAVSGEKDALERHCMDQVENLMELWNKNDEFRKEYIKCNTRSTLKRLRTLDGRSLGPDEEPPSIDKFFNDRVITSTAVNSAPTVSTREIVLPIEAKKPEDKSSKKAVEQKNKTVPAKKVGEAAPKNSLPEASGRTEIKEEKEESKLTKEEEELAMRAEKLRREEEAARLEQQRRLEEKAKAQEALERKKRMAEKAQARAEFKARKEAEQKEKEREKRAKKREKKKARNSSETTESEPALESSSQTITEQPEITEKPLSVAKKPQKRTAHTKQIKTTKVVPPPALRNRGKRRMQQWMWALVVVVILLALFFLGDSNFFRNIKLLNFGPDY